MSLPRAIWAVCVLLALPGGVGAQHFSTVDRPMPATPKTVWSNGLAVVGTVLVDPSNRCVIAQGYVNWTNGLVELFACGKEGKTHESVLVLKASPLDMNIGLLLLGIKEVSRPSAVGTWPDRRGPELDLWVEWERDGKPQRCRAEEWVWNEKTGRALEKTTWIYTGSVVENGYFRALSEDSHIATYWDPWALINLPLDCGADQETLFINPRTIPPTGTPVRLIMQVHQPTWWERFKNRFRRS
jgi:hypothetical protein